jgi:small ligand-binding sensory domain FIST
LVRIAAEIREAVETTDDGEDSRWRIAGAHYVSCTGRGGAHVGDSSSEMQWLRHALGEVPLVGFYAAGEIARHHLYGYTGVLTVFAAPAGD